jgi:hypothetical protein
MNYIFSYNANYYPQSDFLSRNYISAFCESLRRIQFKDKLVLFTESPDRLKPFIKGLDVTLVPVQEITERFHNDDYPLIPGLEDYNIKRLHVKKRYIKENNIDIHDNILFVDSRDTIFQTDPFSSTSTSKLTFGEEALPYINDWSAAQYEMYKFDEPVYNSIMSYKGATINTGVFLGSIENYIKLVDEVLNDHLYVKRHMSRVTTKIPVCDQIIINKLLVLNKPSYCEVLPHQNNFVINYLLDGSFKYTDNTIYVNNKPVSIVHQYDRTPDMLKLLLDQYAV